MVFSLPEPTYRRVEAEEFRQAFQDNVELRNFDDYRTLLSYCNVYGAFVEDVLVGYIAIDPHGEELSSFFVLPLWRNKGIGTGLMQRYSHYAKTVMVWNDNFDAIKIYRRHGFIVAFRNSEKIVVLGKP